MRREGADRADNACVTSTQALSAADPDPPVDAEAATVIARGLRDLALAALALAAFTGLASLAVGGAAGLSAQRAVSGGFLLVGSIVFTAGALAGLRDPARASRRERLSGRGAATGRLTSWADAFQLSAALVGLGMGLVLLGVLLHPRASL